MKKNKKKALIFIFLFSFLLNINILAQENIPGTTPIPAIETEQSQNNETETTIPEELPVDDTTGAEVNEDELADQSIRDVEIVNQPILTPSSVIGEKYKGSGTVVDFTTTGSKVFYTVRGNDNEIFYIIIDMDKTEDNVYLLSAVNKEELYVKEPETVSKNPIPIFNNNNQEETTKEVSKQKDNNNNILFWIFVIIASILFMIYQFLFGKLKNVKLFKKKKNIQEETSEENDNEDIYLDDDDE